MLPHVSMLRSGKMLGQCHLYFLILCFFCIWFKFHLTLFHGCSWYRSIIDPGNILTPDRQKRNAWTNVGRLRRHSYIISIHWCLVPDVTNINKQVILVYPGLPGVALSILPWVTLCVYTGSYVTATAVSACTVAVAGSSHLLTRQFRNTFLNFVFILAVLYVLNYRRTD